MFIVSNRIPRKTSLCKGSSEVFTIATGFLKFYTVLGKFSSISDTVLFLSLRRGNHLTPSLHP